MSNLLIISYGLCLKDMVSFSINKIFLVLSYSIQIGWSFGSDYFFYLICVGVQISSTKSILKYFILNYKPLKHLNRISFISLTEFAEIRVKVDINQSSQFQDLPNQKLFTFLTFQRRLKRRELSFQFFLTPCKASSSSFPYCFLG